ncbi:hypothetical protein B0H14DRAFT_2892144 [Mycena olivaceomarginata]|nr:hypothetical protein B0H14DRAFT_2892144 [Mycena olivaceomarginata]
MSDAATDSNSPPSLFSSFGFSNNLVEVSALTALVGSSVAESMVLGNRGSGVCCSAASSGWLRETLGIRTPSCDSAVGMYLSHDSARASKLRRSIGEPIALFCRQPADTAARNIKDTRPRNTPTSWNDVYAFDHSAAMMLRGIPDTPVGSPLEIHTYGHYTFLRVRDSLFQAITISLSAAKLAEVYVLWSYGAPLLGIISATPIREMVLGRRPEPALGTIDIIAGQLPMISRRGGGRKIVLGAAENARTGLLWRLFWLLGAAVSAVSILFSYIMLGQQDQRVVLIWTGFQFLWLGVRILIYHVADPADPMALRMLVARSWANLPRELKERVFELACALAQSQAFVHPRGQPVIGDTLLSSVMWITGSKITPMDLYDSCIVVFSLPKTKSAASRTIAVPAVRYSLAATFIPKGARNLGYGLTWWYWVPCGQGLWVQIRRPTEHRILDSCKGEIRTDEQVSELLTSGTLNIGLTTVEEVRTTLELSRKACDVLVELFT